MELQLSSIKYLFSLKISPLRKGLLQEIYFITSIVRYMCFTKEKIIQIILLLANLIPSIILLLRKYEYYFL